jgi:hypothetical protein
MSRVARVSTPRRSPDSPDIGPFPMEPRLKEGGEHAIRRPGSLDH